MTKVFILLVGLSYLFGQVARVQLGNIGVNFLDVAVAVTVFLWMISQLVRKDRLFEFTKIPTLFAVFIGIGLLSLLVFSSHLTLQQVGIATLYPLRLLFYSMLYFPVKQLTEKNSEFALKTLFFVGAGIVGIGYLQYFFYPYLRNLYYLGWDDHLYRMFSVFFDPNFASAFFIVFLLFCIDIYLRHKIFHRFLVLGVSLATMMAIFLTYSRTGFIMLIIGLGVYFLLFLSKRKALIALGVSFVLFVALANTKIEGLNPFRTASSAARIESAQHAVQIFQRNPIMGVGFNAYRYAQTQLGFREENPAVPSHADAGTDNSYLFVLATSGIVGGGIFLLLLWQILRSMKERADSNDFPARGLFAGSISMLAGSLFLNILFYPMLILWVVVLSGLIRSKKP